MELGTQGVGSGGLVMESLPRRGLMLLGCAEPVEGFDYF